MANIQVRGAAGRHSGPGYVYVMKNKTEKTFKIGCSRNPERRLREIQRDNGGNIELLGYFKATEMNGAETAAQKAVQEKLGMVKVAHTATDWFENPQGKTDTEILKVVRDAVEEHNAA